MQPGTPEHDALLLAFRDAVRRKIRLDLAAEQAEAEALRAAVVPLVREAISRARAEGHCRRAWLFGSFAWGRPNADSDVDVLIEGDDGEVGWLIAQATPRELHVLRLDEAPPSLVERVLADGVEL